jgi:hypothetical protein
MRKDMTSNVFVFYIVYFRRTAWCCGVLKATEGSFTYIALWNVLYLHRTDQGWPISTHKRATYFVKDMSVGHTCVYVLRGSI